MNKIFSKVTSDLIVNGLCTVTIGAGIAEYCTNVLLTKSYVKYSKEAYRNKQPVMLSDYLQKQYDNVIQDLKHTEFQKAFSTPFAAEGFIPVNVGCLNTRSGCYIGIPTIYNLNSKEDIFVQDDLNLEEYMGLINDKSESGQKFMESLILSEPAKKFSIARELVLTDNFRIFIKSISLPMTLFPMYAIGSYIINLLPANPIQIRVLAFFLLCNVGIFIWLLIRTVTENLYQIDADEIVGNINEEYVRGGIEFYEKLIQRNLALRSIIPGGKTIYSEQGDILGLISVLSELPFSYRKKHLEQLMMKKYGKENQNYETLVKN